MYSSIWVEPLRGLGAPALLRAIACVRGTLSHNGTTAQALVTAGCGRELLNHQKLAGHPHIIEIQDVFLTRCSSASVTAHEQLVSSDLWLPYQRIYIYMLIDSAAGRLPLPADAGTLYATTCYSCAISSRFLPVETIWRW
jgi:hypothetical protein